MKQHITKEQLGELNGNYPAIEKLSEWVHGHEYKDEGFAEYLTIGRMIEFLDWHWKMEERYVYPVIAHDRPVGLWQVDGGRNYADSELCDALWKGVRRKLEGGELYE